MKIKIAGPSHVIDQFRNELLQQPNPDIEIGAILLASEDPFARTPQRLDPLTYFLVAYLAHVAAHATMEAASALIERAKRRGLNAAIEPESQSTSEKPE